MSHRYTLLAMTYTSYLCPMAWCEVKSIDADQPDFDGGQAVDVLNLGAALAEPGTEAL